MLTIIKKYIGQAILIDGIGPKVPFSKGVSPDDAIWFFGDSFVFGCGVEENETAPVCLEPLIKKKVINYGVPGSGPMMVEYQLDKLLKKHKPLAVVIDWPSFNRWQGGSMLGFPIMWMPHCLDEDNVYIKYDHFGCKKVWPELWKEYKNLIISRQLEKDNLALVERVREKLKDYQLVEFQYYPDSYNIKLPAPVFPFIDYGSDNMHCGPKTHMKVAEWIYDQLQQKKYTTIDTI